MKAVLLFVFLAVVGTIFLLVGSSKTEVNVTPAVNTIGISTPVTVRLNNPHGVRRVDAYLEQNGARYPVYEERQPSTWILWSRHEQPRSIAFEAGKSKAPNLKDGKARLVIEAGSNDLRASTTITATDVNVVLEPPRVAPDEFQHYINQGGMELVTMSPSGSWNDVGVKVGTYTFRSFSLPGKDANQRFAMFAYPWDLPPDVKPLVYARNLAGTEATAQFWFKLFPKKFRVRDFELSDALMEKLVNSVDPTGQVLPGKDLLSRFLYINGTMRRQNNQVLADLRWKTEPKALWNGPFLHLGKEESVFADVRNYIYNGKKVDQQVHLGFDLSDLQHSPVMAANDGRVVWARISASTATASWWTTAMACNRSTAICARST